MKFSLKNGEEVEIKELQETRLTASGFLRFISEIVRERPEQFINMDGYSVPSLKEEKKWLNEQFREIKKGNKIFLVALKNGKLIGDAFALRGIQRNHDKVAFGISVSRKHRGKGLGKKLLQETIKLAKKKFKPKIIYLNVVAGNKPAHQLYKKLGFREIGRLRKWVKVRGKYWDLVYMRLK